MTNLLNVLKTMETETTGVKNDVINYLLDLSQDSEDAEGILDNIVTHGCGSGMVNHLIYYSDTVVYFEEHEEEIREFVTDVYEIEELESWDGLQELSDMFPMLETADDRYENAEAEVREIAESNVINFYGEDWYSFDDEEQEEAITLEADSICMYENDPLELNMQDKNCLAWAIFEYEAVNLENELEEMGLIK